MQQPDQRRVAPGRRDPGGDAREAPAVRSRRPARRASRSSACRRSSTARTSARRRTRTGTTSAEPVPGPDHRADAPQYAKKYQMAMVVPVYEREQAGVYYNTAAVVRRRRHVPRQVPQEPHPAHVRLLGEVLLQARATSATRCSRRATRRSASTSATTATSPRARALLGLNGAEIVFNPSATVAGLSQYLWKLEQPAHAVANGYFMARSNRVGTEAPWNIGKFYGIVVLRRPARQVPRRRLARTRTSWSSPRWTST